MKEIYDIVYVNASGKPVMQVQSINPQTRDQAEFGAMKDVKALSPYVKKARIYLKGRKISDVYPDGRIER